MSRRKASALVTITLAVVVAALLVLSGSRPFLAEAAPAPQINEGNSSPQVQGAEAFGLTNGCIKGGVFIPLGGACGDATQLSEVCWYSQEICKIGSSGYGECTPSSEKKEVGTICKQGSGCTPNSTCTSDGQCPDAQPISCPSDTECVQYGCSTIPGAPCIIVKQQPAQDVQCVETREPIICGQKYAVKFSPVVPAKCGGVKDCPASYMLDGPPCPSVDCQVSGWVDPANKPTCGTYTQTRTVIQAAANGGKPCPSLTQTVDLGPCPVDCQVGNWVNPSPLPTCGEYTRTRPIIMGPQNGGKACPNLTEQVTLQACPVDCIMDAWVDPATKPLCGSYTRTRAIIRQAANGGAACGPTTETVNVGACPMCDCRYEAPSSLAGDPELDNWCSRLCAGAGVRGIASWLKGAGGVASASCTCPIQNAPCPLSIRPSNFPTQPTGYYIGVGGFSPEICKPPDAPPPVDCVMSPWVYPTPLPLCGTVIRKRTIISQPSNGGKICGPTEEPYLVGECAPPVDCQVSGWTPSTPPATCGTYTRSRSITVAPENGGAPCPTLVETVDLGLCPVDCQYTWADPTGIPVCGSGTKEQTLVITRAAANGGLACPTTTKRSVSYTLDPCPVSCEYTYEKPSTLPSCGTGTYQETLKISKYPVGTGTPCPTALTRDVAYSLAACTQNSTCSLSGLTGQTIDYGTNASFGAQAYASGATTRLDGNWVFKDGGTIITNTSALAVGKHTIVGEFTPRETIYNPATCSGSLTVKAAATRCELTGATPVRIGSVVSFGAKGYVGTTPLDGGSFSFLENGLPVNDNWALAVGEHNIIGNFTPSDLTKYEKSICEKTFVVNDKIATTCSWASPVDVVYGGGLPPSMFDSTNGAGPRGSVPGAYANFSRNAGQKLPAGSTIVKATFNPTDTSYASSPCTTTVVVSKKSVSCTVHSKSRPYGEPNPELTFSCDGWVGSDSTATVFGSTIPTTTALVSSAAGQYPISLKAPTSLAANNYDIQITNGALTIDQRSAQCIAHSKTMTVGDAVPALTHGCSGFVNGDTAAIFGDPAALLYIDGSTTTAGNPPIRYRNNPGITHINYQVKTTDGTLTINSRALLPTRCEVTVSSVMYGTGLPLSAKAFDGFSNPVAGTFTYSINGKAVSPGDVLNSSDGGYIVTATFTPNLSTYAGSQCSGEFSVARPTVNCIADSAKRPYGTALDKPLGFKCYLGETQITSGISGGSLSAAPAIDALPTNYQITFTSDPTIPNYIVTTTPGWVTIESASTTCKLTGLTGQTVAYGTYVDTMSKGYIGSTSTELSGSFSYKIGSTSLPDSNGIYRAGVALPVGTHTITAAFSTSVGGYNGSQCSGTVTVSGCTGNSQCTVDDKNACTTNTCCTAASCSVGGITVPNGECYNKPITGTVGSMKPSITLTCPTDGASTGQVTFTWTENTTCMNPAPSYRIVASSVATPVFSPTPSPKEALDTTATSAACSAGTCTVTQSIDSSHFRSGKTIYGAVAIYTQSGYYQNESASKATSCAWCGDGAINGSDQCDGAALPAGAAAGSSCSADCKLIAPLPVIKCTGSVHSRLYGAANPALTYICTNAAGADVTDKMDTAGTFKPGPATTAAAGRIYYVDFDVVPTKSGYTIVREPAQIIVSNAPISCRIPSTSRPFGQPNPAFTFSCSGFVGSDTQSTVFGTTVPTTTARALSPVGPYPITLATPTTSNYTFSVSNGTLTVTDALTCSSKSLLLTKGQSFDRAFVQSAFSISGGVVGGEWTFTWGDGSAIDYSIRPVGSRTINGSYRPTVTSNPVACPAVELKVEVCGDGAMNGTEQCDGTILPADKTAAMGYRCNSCKLEWCGDSVINGSEQCDGTTLPADKTAAMGYRCNSCKLERCGDGIINGSEQCDGTALPAGAPAGSTCTAGCNLNAPAGTSCKTLYSSKPGYATYTEGYGPITGEDPSIACQKAAEKLQTKLNSLNLTGMTVVKDTPDDFYQWNSTLRIDQVGCSATACVYTTPVTNPCGNGKVDDGEDCDGSVDSSCTSMGCTCTKECKYSCPTSSYGSCYTYVWFDKDYNGSCTPGTTTTQTMHTQWGEDLYEITIPERTSGNGTTTYAATPSGPGTCCPMRGSKTRKVTVPCGGEANVSLSSECAANSASFSFCHSFSGIEVFSIPETQSFYRYGRSWVPTAELHPVCATAE